MSEKNMNATFLSALSKCARRQPGESVTLTDPEVREIFSHYQPDTRSMVDPSTPENPVDALREIHAALGLRDATHRTPRGLAECCIDAARDIREDRDNLMKCIEYVRKQAAELFDRIEKDTRGKRMDIQATEWRRVLDEMVMKIDAVGE